MYIRPATSSDALAIATVHVRSWKTAYPGLIPQSFLDSLTPEARLQSWNEILGPSPEREVTTLVLVDEAEADADADADLDTDTEPEAAGEPGRDGGLEQIVGFTTFGRNGDDAPKSVGEVMTLYLDPGVWGDGHGERLLGAATEALRRDGYRTATLWVLETNARARRFYERLGWTPDGAKKLHDWKAFVATDVRYRLELDPRRP